MAITRRFFIPTILLTSILLSGCQLLPPTPTAQVQPDGAWRKQGNQYDISVTYPSPGGEENNNFKITLQNDTVTAVTVDVLTEIDASIVYQKKFAAELPKLLVGKKISQISDLDVISGASLTTAAFNEALGKLKKQL